MGLCRVRFSRRAKNFWRVPRPTGSARLPVRAAGLIEIVLGSYAAFIAGICVFRLIPANETWSLDLRRAGSRVHAAETCDLKRSVYTQKHFKQTEQRAANAGRVRRGVILDFGFSIVGKNLAEILDAPWCRRTARR